MIRGTKYHSFFKIASKPIIELTYEKAKILPESENAEDC